MLQMRITLSTLKKETFERITYKRDSLPLVYISVTHSVRTSSGISDKFIHS